MWWYTYRYTDNQSGDSHTPIDLCDGVIVSGGEDVDPIFYQSEPHQHLGFTNPDRDKFEIAVIQHVLEHKKPLLAICRGIQILNVALGGTLIQDIPSQLQNALQHTQQSLEEGTRIGFP